MADKEFKPNFGISHSRIHTFNECARKFYLSYHLSHAGSRWDAHGDARHAYTLKQLTTFEMLLGQQIHARAADIALAIRDYMDIPTLEEMMRATRNELNRVWQTSKNRSQFLRKPRRHPMYQHVYYGRRITNDRLLRLRSRLIRCLSNLATSAVWDEVAKAFPCDVHLFDSRVPVEFEGVQLFAAPDLVWCNREAGLNSAGVFTILDWKTGSDEDVEAQLATYYLFLLLLGVVTERDHVQGRVVCLENGDDYFVELGPPEVELAKERIRAAREDLSALLVDRDTERNEPLPIASYEPRADTEACEWCQFQELCERHLKGFEHPGPF